MQYLLFIILGIAAGILGGTLGVGGGIIVVPLLVLFFGFSQHLAQGTMMVIFSCIRVEKIFIRIEAG